VSGGLRAKPGQYARRALGFAGVAVFALLALPSLAAAQAPACTMTGTDAGEKIRGTAGDDVICGLGGNDILEGHGGNDILRGGDGDDKLTGKGGVDEVDGGPGVHDISYYNEGVKEGVSVNLATGVVADDGRGATESIAGVENVGGARNQVNDLVGDAQPNTLSGGLLADDLSGAGGADVLRGEAVGAPSGGDDTLSGGDGNDAIFPGLGTNTIDGGAQADTLDYSGLVAPIGVDVIAADGAGTTTGPVSDDFTAIESMKGTPKADSIRVSWNGVASSLFGRAGDDTLSTQDGDGLDVMNGGPGSDACDNADDETASDC
jgi:Ca2+-binding RTX toxin-like protein